MPLQGSLTFNHGAIASSSGSKPGSRRPQQGIIESGTLVGHLGIIYNRARDATVTSRPGAVVWKFCTDVAHEHKALHAASDSVQLQVRAPWGF